MGGKKQPKKKSWRKADIADVEEGLEDERLVSKLKNKASKGAEDAKKSGGSKDKEDEELGDEFFTIDTAGSSEGLSRSARREVARAKLFPGKKPNIGMSAAEEAKVERAAAWSKQRRQAKESAFDLWGAPKAATKVSEEFPLIRSNSMRPQHLPGTVHQKVGKAPAVLPAHEGQSMNPELNAYEDLACTAAARELEREREAAELDRKFAPMTSELRDFIDAEELKNMDEETKLKKFREITCSSGAGADGDEDEDGTVHKKGKGRVKSQAQKNRTRRQRVLDQLETQAKSQSRLEKSVGEVGAMLKDMKDEERMRAEKKTYKATLRQEKRDLEEKAGVVPKRRKLGKTTFVEDALLVPDAESAKKGMRAMPLKGGVIHDRLSSIMRRGLLPANPQATKSEAIRKGKKAGRLKRSRKFASPLAREFVVKKGYKEKKE